MMNLPQQDMLKMQTCVLKVNIHCQGCERKVEKILNKVQGVHAVDVNAEQGRVTVTGVTDPATLINKLAKSGKPAELLKTPTDNQPMKNVLLPNIKIIDHQSDDDTNKVPIPKGMKVVKEVKVLANDQNDVLKASDEGVNDGNTDSVKAAAKGKGIEARVVKSGKKGTRQDFSMKKKLHNPKANRNLSGGIENVRNGQGFDGAKAEQVDKMTQLRPMIYDHMDAVELNKPQYPMENGNMYHNHTMGYLQPGSGGGHSSLPPPPPPAATNNMAHIFNDENANGCWIM